MGSLELELKGPKSNIYWDLLGGNGKENLFLSSVVTKINVCYLFILSQRALYVLEKQVYL